MVGAGGFILKENDNDDGPSAAEQQAFTEAHALIRHLIEVDGLSPVDVGTGVLIAALSRLLKTLPETDVAALLYKYADDYATRHLGLERD
jgi:hypothetical protein